ncbi:MAG: hypothetical protein ACLR23_20410 [Clostridia bacterium]
MRPPGDPAVRSGRYDKIVAMIEQSEQLAAAENRHPIWRGPAGALYPGGKWPGLSAHPQHHPRAVGADGGLLLRIEGPCRWQCCLAMGEASRFHVTVKGGKYLEAVAQADTIIFDKTGTLDPRQPHGGPGDILQWTG